MTNTSSVILLLLMIQGSVAFVVPVGPLSTSSPPSSFRRPDPFHLRPQLGTNNNNNQVLLSMKDEDLRTNKNNPSPFPSFIEDGSFLPLVGGGIHSDAAILERRIADLAQQWQQDDTPSFRQQIEQQEASLQLEIGTLTNKLVVADAKRLHDAQLKQELKRERQELQQEIKSLQQEVNSKYDYKTKYETEQKDRTTDNQNNRLEIKRLQEEVRVVFSIGRRTSDKIVKDLRSRLSHKDERLQMALDDVERKEEYIQQLEQERKSLRSLWKLSWKLTLQRLRHRVVGMRHSFLSMRAARRRKVLPAVNGRGDNSNLVRVQQRRKGRRRQDGEEEEEK